MDERPLKGVFSTSVETPTDPGMSRRQRRQKRYWLVWDVDDKTVSAQPLNQNLVPSGPERFLNLEDFRSRFTSEPGFLINEEDGEVVLTRKERRQKTDSVKSAAPANLPAPQAAPTVAKAPAPPTQPVRTAPSGTEAPAAPVQKKTKPWAVFTAKPPAEKAFDPALELNLHPTPAPGERLDQALEKSARAGFFSGLALLRKGKVASARKLFEYLATAEADFVPRHKHMFNEFGISLRKTKLSDVAVKHYERALELAPDEENLHFNLARAHYEQGRLDEAASCLEKSLELNPSLEEARRFLSYIHGKKGKKKLRFRL